MLSKNSKRRDCEVKLKPLVFPVETGEIKISSDIYVCIIQKAGEIVAEEREEDEEMRDAGFS